MTIKQESQYVYIHTDNKYLMTLYFTLLYTPTKLAIQIEFAKLK